MAHWRKGDKSDFLMSWDIEGELKATIVKVVRTTTKVRGQNGEHRIAYFKEDLKPIIVNVENGNVIERATGTHLIEKWADINVPVILYVREGVRFGKETVRGLRIRADEGLPNLLINTPSYQAALKHLKGGGKISDIELKYKISEEVKLKIENDCNN